MIGADRINGNNMSMAFLFGLVSLSGLGGGGKMVIITCVSLTRRTRGTSSCQKAACEIQRGPRTRLHSQSIMNYVNVVLPVQILSQQWLLGEHLMFAPGKYCSPPEEEVQTGDGFIVKSWALSFGGSLALSPLVYPLLPLLPPFY